MVILFFPVTLAAIVGLGYVWVVTYREMRSANAAGWRQTAAWLSVGAVTAQVLLCAAMFFFLSHNERAIDGIAGVEVVLFVAATACAIPRKGFARWWLILCSLYFLTFAGFVYVVSGIQF